MMKLIALNAKVDLAKMSLGFIKNEDAEKIQKAADLWYNAPFFIIDKPSINITELQESIRLMVKKHNVRIVFIDSLSFVLPDNMHVSLNEQRAVISRTLKILARELEIPIVVLCEIPRGSNGDEPSFAFIKNLGAIEHHADLILFVHSPRILNVDETPLSKVIIAKHRNGSIGEINLKFTRKYSLFEEQI